MRKITAKAIFCSLLLAAGTASIDAVPVWAAETETNVSVQAENPFFNKTLVRIDIAGNKQIDTELIRAAVQSKLGETLTEEMIRQDMKSIYELGWFTDITVNFRSIPEGTKVTYTIIENPVLTDIVLEGNTKLESAAILEMLHVVKGEVLNARQLNQDTRAIEEKYHADGYIFAKVSDINMSADGVLKLSFNEGILEGYQVKGNDKTKEKVILREMRQEPGEPFNAKDARRSMQRIHNLGFFEDVNMKINPGKEPNGVVLETDVVEQRTGSFTIGAGYSNEDGLIGILGVRDSNFRGTGDSIGIQWEFGGDDDDYNSYIFSYRHPWLDDKETALSFKLYDRTFEYDDYNRDGDYLSTYDKKYKGFELGFSRPVTEYSTNSILFKDRTDKYKEYVSGIDYTAKPGQANFDSRYEHYIEDNFGKTRSITLAHITDTRDNIYNPTEGNRASLSAEFAGLGGDFDYQKYTLENSHFIKVGHAQVIALRGLVGMADGDMPESALFELGGQDTLRGYRDDQFEGKKALLGTVEYRFPLANKVQGALFTDFGDAWTGDYNDFSIHSSVGVGLMLNTPLGPMRLDYGHGENGGRTHFTFGGAF